MDATSLKDIREFVLDWLPSDASGDDFKAKIIHRLDNVMVAGSHIGAPPELLAAAEFANAALEAIKGAEADYDEQIPDDHEIGCIEESRNSPSFRIRIGHIRRLAAALAKAEFAPSSTEMEELREDLKKALAQIESLESLRPHWAKGYSSDSMAAQSTTHALSTIWRLLGVDNQTFALQKLRDLLKSGATINEGEAVEAMVLSLSNPFPSESLMRAGDIDDWRGIMRNALNATINPA